MDLRRHHRFLGRACVLLAIVVGISLSVRGEEERPAFPTPIEFVPYSVSIQVDVPHAAEREALDVSAFSPEFRSAITRSAGERWTIAHTLDSHQAWARSAAWSTLDHKTAAAQLPVVDAEFLYLVRIRSQAGIVRAEVRLWEPLWKWLSPLRTVTTADPRALPELTAQAVWELFRPRGLWEKNDDSQATLRIQAAALGLDAGLPPLVQTSEVFTPWVVMRKRDQSVERTVTQAWTYLISEALTEGRGTARIVSGLRNPLSLKPRGRVEFVAVAARSLWPETRFTFRRQSSPPEVLAAHEVQWHRDQFPLDEEHPPELHRQLTDRFGRVTLPRSAEAKLEWLSITSGSQLLARLPIVPGEDMQREVLLPDDSLRLQVEGQLQLVQSDLVSFVATRTALMAICRTSAKKADWATVDARLKHLDALPAPQSFLDRVTSIRVTAVAKARNQRDRTAEQRINRMADDTSELVKRYLNDDKIALLKEEVAELRKATSDDPEPEKPKS